MAKISSKSGVSDFSGSRIPLLGGFTIFERSWNYGNLPYLVANIYGLNFIKIGGIWIFRGGGGEAKPPIRGGYMWPVMPIFELGWAILVNSHVWKFGLDWLSLSKVIVVTNNFPEGQKSPIRGGYIWSVMPILELGWAIPVKSLVWKFGSDWLKSEVC